jgi:mannitol/fructose-specific phosphotransferase system IIA component (Ntr-type)
VRDKEDAMTRPTFSILVDTEENTNLAIKQLTQIALEQGIITEQELEQMGSKAQQPLMQESTI